MEQIIVNSLKETAKFAKVFGRTLTGGEVILLSGDLGAGKTTFSRSLIMSLGVKDEVTSPTFTIMKEYFAKKFHIVHFDMYRITNPSEAQEFGFEEYVYNTPRDTIVLIEWPENMGNYFDKVNTVKINIIKEVGDRRLFQLER